MVLKKKRVVRIPDPSNMTAHRFIKNRDIILFSLQPWNSQIAFNLKDLAYELARYNRILFIDRANDRKTILKSKFSAKQFDPEMPKSLETVGNDFWVLHPKSLMESGNWSPNYKLFDFFNRINNRRLALEIKSVIQKLAFNDILFINDNDFFRGLYLKTLLPISVYIFYLRDFLTAQPYFIKFGPRCEKEIIAKADLVVANSTWLAEYAGRWNQRTAYIGQGCNLSSFNRNLLPEPSDLKSVPKPVIGYFGAITGMRLDEALLLHIAASMPEMSLVLVGPVDEQFEKSRLRLMNNVFFLGAKNPEQSADYIRHFTICINPQLVNQLTIGNYPRKIDEYLAAGKPVIATATEAMDMFRHQVMLCNTMTEYITAIRKAIEDPFFTSAEAMRRRVEFASTHSWENVAGVLGEACFRMIKNNKPDS